MSVCWGATDFGKGALVPALKSRQHAQSVTGYDVANQTAYLDDMLRWGLNWLLKVRSSSKDLLPVLISRAGTHQ